MTLQTAEHFRKQGVRLPQIFYVLLGKPGVGKSEISQRLAQALKRPIQIINVGGMDDGGELEGKRATLQSANYGKMMEAFVERSYLAEITIEDLEREIKEIKTRKETINAGTDEQKIIVKLEVEIEEWEADNERRQKEGKETRKTKKKAYRSRSPVILLDEFEKASREDILNVIGKITDRELNYTFLDKYFNFNLDISQAVILLTANYLERVPQFVQDRGEPVNIELLSYAQRKRILEIISTIYCRTYGIAHLRNRISEKFLEMCITETWGIRGGMNNLQKVMLFLVGLEVKGISGDLDDLVGYDEIYETPEEDYKKKESGVIKLTYLVKGEERHLTLTKRIGIEKRTIKDPDDPTGEKEKVIKEIITDRIDERGGTINKGKKKENPDYRDLVIYTGTLDKQEYFTLRNKNNQLTIIFQNKKQLDFIRPDTVIFFGRNTADKEGKARQERAGRKGIDGDENTGDNNCPACDNCYDFCGDLRNKKACSIGIRKVSVQSITDDTCEVCQNTNPNWISTDAIMSDVKVPSLLFIVDGKHRGKDGASVPTADPRREPKNQKNYIWEELPKCYHEQPHLLNHSSAQFYFQKKLLFTANLKHLLVKRKNPGFQLELKVKGSISDTNFLNQLIGSVVGGFMKKAGGKLLKLGSKIPWVGGLFEAAGEAVEGDKKTTGTPSMADILTGKKYGELLGAKTEDKQTQNKDQSENEQQTKRQKASTAKKFANRCVANPFMIRFEHSEVLYNNLLNNTEKARSPIQNIQCSFSAFKQCIKVGPWQGNIELFFDINNTMKGTCLQSFTHGDTFNSATAIGEEDTEYIPGEDKRETKQEVPANSAVGHMGIFPVDNPNKDYFSELCTADMDANSVNPGAGARDSTDDQNTQFNSNIGETDPESLPELEEEREYEGKEFEDKETDIKENQGETERDFEKELQKEKEREKERELERQAEQELEKEKEKDREKEKDLEREKQREQELQAEREKKQKESQREKEKKEQARKEREQKTRERQQQKERDKKDKDKREKEKKERE
ncbi:16969_t:CDS:10 [Gigaspora margarita]|uniref:16969_t:CDS:1 n=1 Tax=Gigaspora margarita TaxID=4874 RepID=A0ABM8VW51_GIGMA|nr:16969_t:CDS:10 [Gigaspora margarita]